MFGFRKIQMFRGAHNLIAKIWFALEGNRRPGIPWGPVLSTKKNAIWVKTHV